MATKEFNNSVSVHQNRLVAEELTRLMGWDVPASEMKRAEVPGPPTAPNSPLTPLPLAPVASPAKTMGSLVAVNGIIDIVCQVQFKCIHRHCAYSYPAHNSNLVVTTGSFVIISREIAGHEDIGVVTRVYSAEAFRVKKAGMPVSQDREENEVGTIIRLAVESDLVLLPTKHAREEELLKLCQHLSDNVFMVPMKVYGADYQLDGKILTFYYTSDTRADYRELVRMMYGYCQVRIKMRKTNLCRKFVPMEFATKALQLGHH